MAWADSAVLDATILHDALSVSNYPYLSRFGALVEILTQPKNALIKQFQKLFEMEDVRLTFSEEALESISKKAITRKTGARGLRSILEDILLDPMFDLPGYDSVEEVVINHDVVEGRLQPLLIYGDKPEELESSAS